MSLDVILFLPASCSGSFPALPVPLCEKRSCFVKTHSRIPRYDTHAVPIMAHPFDALAQSIWLATRVCKILATLQIIPSLQRMPIILTMAKRKISLLVTACLCLNVQYLLQPKLFSAPSMYAIEL